MAHDPAMQQSLLDIQEEDEPDMPLPMPMPPMQRKRSSFSDKSTPDTQLDEHKPAGFFTYPVRYAVASALRRLSSDTVPFRRTSSETKTATIGDDKVLSESPTTSNLASPSAYSEPMASPFAAPVPTTYTPPRTFAPFQPPPLTPLTLLGWDSSTPENARVLTRQLAEEIRLLVPPRLQLSTNWTLLFSLEQDGASLATLYAQCAEEGPRTSVLTSNGSGRDNTRAKGYVLTVCDGAGAVFGAYLTDPPRRPRESRGHYYGTGECFLWRSSVVPRADVPIDTALSLLDLPPLPSEDTTNATRTTTLGPSTLKPSPHHSGLLAPRDTPPRSATSTPRSARSGAATPDRIRFKAFPYSGLNDYLIFCDDTFLSVGGGDGHYGLWIDANLERGISQTCLTFGNEGLSEEGNGEAESMASSSHSNSMPSYGLSSSYTSAHKPRSGRGRFEVFGVEVWCIGT